MRKLGLALGSFFFIIGCAHTLRKEAPVDTSILPPSAKEIASSPEQRNVNWWKTFRQAEAFVLAGQPENACASHRLLAVDNNFPLRDLSVLRARELCANVDGIAATESLDPRALGWFEETSVRARRNHFEQLKPNEQVALLWDTARLEKDDRKKESALVQAVSLAEKTDDATLRREAQSRLWRNSPRLNPKPEAKDLAAVANDQRKWREFAKAIQTEKQRLQAPGARPEEKFAALKSIRQIYKVSQKKEEMLQATTDLVNFAMQQFRKNKRDFSAAKRLLDSRTLYARTLWTEDHRDLAIKALRETRRDLTNRISLEEVDFLFGRLAEEIGNLDEAQGHFANALKQTPIVPGLHDKIEWARAWVLHKLGRKDEASTVFANIVAHDKDPVNQARAAFWQARETSDATAREKLFRQIRDQDPLGYYGMMATRELHETFAAVKIPGEGADLRLTSARELSNKVALTAEWLIAVEWTEGLERVLDSAQSELKRASKVGNDTWLRLTSAYARGGEYLPLFSMIGTLPAEVRDRLLKDHPELLFPRPWQREVESAGLAANVPAPLIYGIMRQESAFNPRARSGAEAYGLMQLLPELANSLAKTHKISYTNAESLYEPEPAIRLGAYALRAELDRWQDRWIPAVASYNASRVAVAGWIKVRHRDDPLEFIEEIPYEETRAYVKLVMRNQVFYQRLLATGPTPFPEKALELAAPEKKSSQAQNF